MSALPTAILLMGPTASGKTALAMELADRLPLELISVDSALVYRGMDIGSAKPSPAELARYPHRLIDIREPNEAYSAADFRADALAAMAEIHAAGRIPLLVGGTMLYFRALTEGLSPLPASDPAIRRELEARWQSEGLERLHAELAEIDPASAERIHHNDPQRILRALEVYRLSGRPLTELWAEQAEPAPGWRFLKLALWPEDRAQLHQRIESRFEQMLELGLLDEVRALRARGDLDLSMPSMRAVGYRQAWQFLDGEFDEQELRDKGKAATRQLAKRQITWLRSEQGLERLPDSTYAALQCAERYIRSALRGE